MPVIRFKAKPFTIGAWTILKVPMSASAELPSRGQVMVKGTINGFSFQTALEPDGNGSHWLNVDKDMQRVAKVDAGNAATLAIESTKDWPEPKIPADLKAALADHPQVQALWARITPMARWEWIRWIGSTSQSETRKRRIEVASSKLTAGMRRPCCFNRSMCCVPAVSKNGVLLEPASATK
ncbi:MAG: YdeI/OmpD-associated family protein [Candidatus Saccharimonadales bacterium]